MKRDNQIFATKVTINFNLRNKASNKASIIYCYLNISGQRYKCSTNVKVIPSQWDSKRQLAKVLPSLTPLDNHNNIIANDRIFEIKKIFQEKLFTTINFDNFAKDFFLSVNPQQNSTPIMTKKTKKSNIKEEETTPKTGTDFIEKMLIEDPKIGRSSFDKTYRCHLTAFINFLKKKKIKNDFNNFTYEVLEEYAEHLNQTQKGEYRRQLFASIKRWLPKLEDYGVGYNYDPRIKRIKTKKIIISAKEKGDEYIALSHDQIYKIYNLTDDDLKDSTLKLDKLKYYKNMFVMQCFCGCRASDVDKLFDEENLNYDSNGSPFVEFWAQKTSNSAKAEKCVVPLTLYPEQLIIFEEYKNTKMYACDFTGESDNTYNTYIKEICRIAGFNKILKRTIEGKGGKKIKEEKPIYERITSHVARHSFITNCVKELGFSKDEIKNMVGHGSTQYIESVYLNLTTIDKADMMAKSRSTTKQHNPEPQTQQPHITQTATNSIIKDNFEALLVLKFLGVDVDNYTNEQLSNEQVTQRLIVEREIELRAKMGERYSNNTKIYQAFKNIFNNGLSMSARKEMMIKFIEEQKEKGITKIEQLE